MVRLRLNRVYRIASFMCVLMTLFLLMLVFKSTRRSLNGSSIGASVDDVVEVITPEPESRQWNPLILFFTTVFNSVPSFPEDCPIRDQCRFSTNRSHLSDADAVVFHGGDFLADEIPAHRPKPTQKWVYYSMETHMAKSLSFRPGWKSLRPDWTMTYMKSSDIPSPYGGILVDLEQAKTNGIAPLANFSVEAALKHKQFRGAVGFISNCENRERLKVVKALSRHMRVDLGGKCAFDVSKKDLCPRHVDCTPMINWYYFYLAFENANCVDYITEKFTDRLKQPVAVLPDDAYIAVDDFKTVKELADHLKYLMRHPSEYLKLFNWRRRWALAPWNGEGYEIGMCALCRKLLNSGRTLTKPIPDLVQHLTDKSQCGGLDLPANWST